MKLLYQIHRWVGLALAVFMFFWFLTGLVIMYAPQTTQTRGQQLAHAETLAPDVGWLSVGEAWDRSTGQRKDATSKAKTAGNAKEQSPAGIADARLVRNAGEPLWLVEDNQGRRFALSALDGSLRNVSPDQAVKIAKAWLGSIAGDVNYLETVDNPIILRNQDALKPFHRIGFGDGGELLISARTGEVLHESSRLDRAFYWAGNWLHLLKPLESIGLGNIRHDAQLWLGLFATIATLAGLIIGWLRWRPGFGGRPTYSEGRTQPYREFWFKWHFWSGLIGGSMALFWALSGYIDTNPGKLFAQANPSKQELARYAGGELPEAAKNWLPALPLSQAAAVDGSDVVELSWRNLDKEAVLLAHTRDGQRLPQATGYAPARFSEAALLAAVGRVAGNAKIASQTVLNEYDSYYYPRHHQSLIEKPLPVLLVQLDDAAGTRFYLDPQDGKLIAKLDQSARVFRWLYSALHHWDFGWLYYRPIWDVWMLTWVSLGLVLGGSSVVLGWRLLKKTFAPKKRKARRVPVVERVVETPVIQHVDVPDFVQQVASPAADAKHRF